MLKKNKNIVAIVGPTGVGKTKMAIDLALSVEKFSDYSSGEIISCDSRQIYKDMDIVTAMPSVDELSKIKHYLINYVSPKTSDYSVAIYVEQANKKIEELLEENKLPVFVGGTGLYFKSLLGEFDIPKVPPNIELRNELNEKSNEELHKLLLSKDEKLAQKIHPNNKNKIVRALEVIDALKIPMSDAQKTKDTDYNVIWVGLDAKNREFLYERINKRCEMMLNNGLLDELKAFIDKYGEIDLVSATIGYREFLPYLKNEIQYKDAVDKFKQHTRNYAKRQLSWFRKDKSVNWFFIDEMSDEQILDGIMKLCS